MRLLRTSKHCKLYTVPTGTEPKGAEGIRVTLQRLVNQQILTDTQRGLFALAQKQA